MVTITIRDVPDETRQALANRARHEGKSLQSYLLAVLEQQAGLQRNLEIAAKVEQRARQGHGIDRSAPQTSEVLRAAREERGAE